MEENNATKPIWQKSFWRAQLERVIASVFGAAAAILGTNSIGLTQIDWIDLMNVSLGAGVASLIKGIAAGAKDGNPSVGNAEVTK